jgi:hypothetical protein
MTQVPVTTAAHRLRGLRRLRSKSSFRTEPWRLFLASHST